MCCLGFGAALGLRRDQDLIGHDDDLDILVALPQKEFPSLPAGLSRIEKHLRDNGFKIEGGFFSHLWVRHPDGERCDVFVGLIEDDGRLSFYPSARNSLETDILFPAIRHDLLGQNLPFPRELDEYLLRTYGPGWMIPDIKFEHPWDRSQFKDLDGPRSVPALMTRGEMRQKQIAMSQTANA